MTGTANRDPNQGDLYLAWEEKSVSQGPGEAAGSFPSKAAERPSDGGRLFSSGLPATFETRSWTPALFAPAPTPLCFRSVFFPPSLPLPARPCLLLLEARA